MSNRDLTILFAGRPAPSSPAVAPPVSLVRAAGMRLMPVSSPLVGRPDPAYAGAGR